MAVMFFMVFWVVLSKYSISLWFIPRLNAANRLSVRWKNKKMMWTNFVLLSNHFKPYQILSNPFTLWFIVFLKKIFDNFQNFVNTDKEISLQ